MSSKVAASSFRCSLCNSELGLRSAGFTQRYLQGDGSPALLPWLECDACHGWFVSSPPTPSMIAKNWHAMVCENLDRDEANVAHKKAVFDRLLQGIAQRRPVGSLLDVGCYVGAFAIRAKKVGWQAVGYDPNPAAVQIARDRGLDVCHAWNLEECNFESKLFHAITAIDVFYYSWHPFRDLKAFYDSLHPGGVLAMRISNKRFVLGLFRRLTRAGERRDKKLSALLQSQFHSISAPSLTRILEAIGYEEIHLVSHAATVPFWQLNWRSRVAYLGSDLIYFGSLGKINISPGVLLFARKPVRAGT